MKITQILTTAVAALITITATTMNVDAAIYAKFEGVDGESNSSGHKQSVVHELSRDPNTGEITETMTLKRETDETSVELVRAFLDAAEVELVMSNSLKRIVIISSYSQSDDGTEEFSFSVEREMKESGEKGGTTDMNIGIGEECGLLLPAVQAARAAAQDDPDADDVDETEDHTAGDEHEITYDIAAGV